jgi:hypothetical protein
LIGRLKSDDDSVFFFMQIINSIDDVFGFAKFAGNAPPSTIDSGAALPPRFIFAMILAHFFEFPDDVLFVSLLFRSLRILFVDQSCQRHFFNGVIPFLTSEMDGTIPLRIVTIVHRILEVSSACLKERETQMMKKCIRAAADGLDFVMFCHTFTEIGVAYGNDILPMFRAVEDVGIICRLIVFGLHMRENAVVLSELADGCCGRGFVSDLTETSVIYPFGLPGLGEIVKPHRPGSNWRLIVYLSLQFTDFQAFRSRASAFIGEVLEGRMEVQIMLILIDMLAARVSQFEEFVGECIALTTEIVRVVLERDATVLRPLLRLLRGLNAVRQRVQYQGNAGVDLLQTVNGSVRRFGRMQSNKVLRRMIASVRGECELLASGGVEPPAEEEEREESESAQARALFAVEASDEEPDFVQVVDDYSEED